MIRKLVLHRYIVHYVAVQLILVMFWREVWKMSLSEYLCTLAFTVLGIFIWHAW